MYEYITFCEDRTLVTHSRILNRNGRKEVEVHFERPTEDGFDSVRFTLPSYEWRRWEGNYTDEEIARFEKFVRKNAYLLYKYAEIGGPEYA